MERTRKSSMIVSVKTVASRVVLNRINKEKEWPRYGGQPAGEYRLSPALGKISTLYDIKVESNVLGRLFNLWKNVRL